MDRAASSEKFVLYKGLVVWAKVYGYPWWPASITTDQRSGKWFHKGKYWVYFFNDPQGAWLKPNCLKEFNEANTTALTPKENHKYYKQIIKAVEEAREVHSNTMPPEEIAALVQTGTAEDNVANATTEEEDVTEEEKETSHSSQDKRRSVSYSGDETQRSRKRKAEEQSSETSKKHLRKSSRNSQTNLKSIQKGFRYRDIVFQMPVDRPYHELDPSDLENPQSQNITSEELQTQVEQLQRLSDLFCSKTNDINAIQEALRRLSDEINEKINQLEKHCDEVYSIEGQLLQSLKALFQSRVTIPMLKNSRAGKPVVQLEKSCGPNSSAIRSMAKQLVRQWKKMIMETTPSKKTQQATEMRTSEEQNGRENYSYKETADEDSADPSDNSEDRKHSHENGDQESVNCLSAQDSLNFRNNSKETEECDGTENTPPQ